MPQKKRTEIAKKKLKISIGNVTGFLTCEGNEEVLLRYLITFYFKSMQYVWMIFIDVFLTHIAGECLALVLHMQAVPDTSCST